MTFESKKGRFSRTKNNVLKIFVKLCLHVNTQLLFSFHFDEIFYYILIHHCWQHDKISYERKKRKAIEKSARQESKVDF